MGAPREPARPAVLVDRLFRAQPTGVGTYAVELVRELERGGQEPSVLGFARRGDRPDDRYGTAQVRLAGRRRVTHLRWSATGTPSTGSVFGLSGPTHSTNLSSPAPFGQPLVVTVQDLTPLTHPTYYPARVSALVARTLRGLAQSRSVALCISRHTADTLLNEHPSMAERVHVAPLGPSPLQPSGDSPLRTRTILSVGELGERKRPIATLRAFEAARLPGWQLIFAGSPGSAYEDLRREIACSPVADAVSIEVRPSDQRLAQLYEQSTLFLLLSTVEGFGIPVLDAMRFGVVPVTSNGGNLDALNPHRDLCFPVATPAAEIGEAMRSLTGDDGRLARLSNAGRLWSGKFSWRAHAEAAVCAYAQLAASRDLSSRSSRS